MQRLRVKIGAWLVVGASAASAVGAQAPAGLPDSARAAAPADSARVLFAGWTLRGDRIVGEDDLAALFPWVPGDSLPAGAASSSAARLERALVQGGWWGASVSGEYEEAQPAGQEIALHVIAGEPVVLGAVGIQGNRLLAREEILALADLTMGENFDAARCEAAAARILRAYAERGYPLARVYPGRFRKMDDGRLSFSFTIGEGPETFVESLRVFGETSTSEEVVARIGGVRPLDRWDVRRFENMARRLRREEIFQRVGEPRVVRGSRDNQLGIEIEIEEGKTNSVLGVLGYNPDPAGGGELVGLVDLNLGNILGTARRASLHFERQAAGIQDVSFRFREPWVLGSPLSLEGGAAQSVRDTLYTRTDLDLALGIPLGFHSTATVAAERRTSSFDAFDGSRVSEVSTGGSVGLASDARDRRVNPRRGWAASLRVGVRNTEEGERRTRGEANGQILLPWGSRWGFSEQAGFRGVWSTAIDIPLYENYFLGGTNTVRGYREEQFRGERIWWARSELRYRLAEDSRAYLFADVGGYDFETREATGELRTETDVVPGGGIGISVPTGAAGRARFEIALGRGDAFSDAKVHASVEQEF
jgi:outer membrane protein insertion porin family